MGKGHRRPTRWRSQMPGFTVCPLCLAVVDNKDLRDMARPDMARGVKWCITCCLDYLEVPLSERSLQHADPATRRIIAGSTVADDG